MVALILHLCLWWNTDSPPQLFANLTDDCRPIAIKSRKYSRDDLTFVDSEVKRLLEEGIIEPSESPWRAQVVVTKGESHKKRMVIDYSQTINRFTQLDAFPLPRISDMITSTGSSVLSTYKVRITKFLSGRKNDLIPHLRPAMAYINSPVSPLVSLMGLPASSGKYLILCVKKSYPVYSLIWIISPYVERIRQNMMPT